MSKSLAGKFGRKTGGVKKAPVQKSSDQTKSPNVRIGESKENVLELYLSQRLPQLTKEQLAKLLDLKYVDGEAILTVDRPDVVLEVVQLITSFDLKLTLEFLDNSINDLYVVWDSPFMENAKIDSIREIKMLTAKEKGVTTAGKCLFCGSTSLLIARKQMRSGDEGTSIVTKCCMCGRMWIK